MEAYRTVLVGMDFTPRCEATARAAIALADRLGSERVHVVHVVKLSQIPSTMSADFGPSEIAAEVSQALVEDARRRLDSLEVPEGRARVTRDVVLGIPTRELVQIAEEIGAGLIVVASRGLHGLTGFVLGSVAKALVRAAHCPVLVLREGQSVAGPFTKVLAAIDLSSVSAEVIVHASRFAEASSGNLELVSVFEPPLLGDKLTSSDPTDIMAELRDGQERALHAVVRAAYPLRKDLQVQMPEGKDAPSTIIEHASRVQADLLVAGTSGHGAWHRMLLGSVANRLLTEAPCPVLIVPHVPASVITD